jgi:hypothetical protein
VAEHAGSDREGRGREARWRNARAAADGSARSEVVAEREGCGREERAARGAGGGIKHELCGGGRPRRPASR